MSEQSMSGLLIFLRYAYPCAEAQLAKDLIDTREYALLQRWIKMSIDPMIEILEKAFPEAFAKLLQLAKKRGRDVWSLDNVLDFWRNHHNYKNGNCNVKLCKVIKIDGITVALDDNSMALNIYDVNVIVGRSVFAHRGIVVEVI